MKKHYARYRHKRLGLLRGMGEILLELMWQHESNSGFEDWITVPLEYASHTGDRTCVRMLLHGGARVFGYRGSSPLMATLEGSGDVDVVQTLLDFGALMYGVHHEDLSDDGSAKTDSEGDTNVGHVRILPDVKKLRGLGETLLELVCKHASQSQFEYWVARPLEFACYEGNSEYVQNLLRAGARLCGIPGTRSPRRAAEEGSNDPGVLKTLREYASKDQNPTLSEDRKYNDGEDSDEVEPYAWEPMHLAAYKGHRGAVRALIKFGADPNEMSIDGFTPLHLALEKLHKDVAMDLVIAGANPFTHTADKFSNHPSALMMATEFEDDTKLLGAMLRSRHTGPISYDLALCCALAQAASFEHIHVMRFLVDNHAPLSHGDMIQPLNEAIIRGNSKSVAFLLKAGANPNPVKGSKAMIPLHCTNDSGIIQQLLSAGADPDVRSNFGRTPLYEACKKKMVSLVRILLRWGADENKAALNGVTPLQMMENKAQRSRQDEPDPNVVRRILYMLRKAPFDRAWRRRGWLIMLLYHLAIPRATVDSPPIRKLPKKFRTPHMAWIGFNGREGWSTPRRNDAVRCQLNGQPFRDLVERTLGLPYEDCFKKVVSML